MRRALLVLLLVPAFGLVLTSAANAHAVLHVSGTDLGPDAGTTSCHPINAAGSLLQLRHPRFRHRVQRRPDGHHQHGLQVGHQLQLERDRRSRCRAVHRLAGTHGFRHAEVGDEVPRCF